MLLADRLFFYQLDQQVAYGLPLLGRKGFETVEQRIWQVEGDTHDGSFAQKYICAQGSNELAYTNLIHSSQLAKCALIEGIDLSNVLPAPYLHPLTRIRFVATINQRWLQAFFASNFVPLFQAPGPIAGKCAARLDFNGL